MVARLLGMDLKGKQSTMLLRRKGVSLRKEERGTCWGWGVMAVRVTDH